MLVYFSRNHKFKVTYSLKYGSDNLKTTLIDDGMYIYHKHKKVKKKMKIKSIIILPSVCYKWRN